MNSKAKLALLLALAGLLAGGAFFWVKTHGGPPVQVTMRLSVVPADKVDYVLEQARSARFKYMIGKVANARPYLAQRLELKPIPGSGDFEARIGLENQEEARRYLETFAEALQTFCGSQVRIAAVKDSADTAPAGTVHQ